jgi:hypothetical protein
MGEAGGASRAIATRTAELSGTAASAHRDLVNTVAQRLELKRMGLEHWPVQLQERVAELLAQEENRAAQRAVQGLAR